MPCLFGHKKDEFKDESRAIGQPAGADAPKSDPAFDNLPPDTARAVAILIQANSAVEKGVKSSEITSYAKTTTRGNKGVRAWPGAPGVTTENAMSIAIHVGLVQMVSALSRCLDTSALPPELNEKNKSLDMVFDTYKKRGQAIKDWYSAHMLARNMPEDEYVDLESLNSVTDFAAEEAAEAGQPLSETEKQTLAENYQQMGVYNELCRDLLEDRNQIFAAQTDVKLANSTTPISNHNIRENVSLLRWLSDAGHGVKAFLDTSVIPLSLSAAMTTTMGNAAEIVRDFITGAQPHGYLQEPVIADVLVRSADRLQQRVAACASFDDLQQIKKDATKPEFSTLVGMLGLDDEETYKQARLNAETLDDDYAGHLPRRRLKSKSPIYKKPDWP